MKAISRIPITLCVKIYTSALAGLCVSALTAVAYPGTTATVSGGDFGQGISLDAANVVGALNVGGHGTPLLLQGVEFMTDETNTTALSFNGFGSGATVQEFSGSGINFSGGGNNDSLNSIANTLFFGTDYMGITVGGLNPNSTYKFDVISSLAGFGGPRGLEIFAQNTDQANGTIQDHLLAGSTDVFDTTFLWTVGADGQVNIGAVPGTYDGTYPDDPVDGSWMNGLVITQVPEPGGASLMLLGLGGVLGFRRLIRR